MKSSSKLNIIIQALGLFMLAGCASSQGPKLLNELEFKDPQFSKCIKQQGIIRLDKIEEINCNNFQITSVYEIKYMPALKDIILLSNNIKQIDISKLQNLKRLIIANNQLTSIDLSSNTKLTALNITNNKLKNLDISNNLKLKSLYAYKMPLKSIDITKNLKLRDLGLSRHNLESIDLSNNLELKTLNLSVGTLSQIDLSYNKKLTHLHLSSNKITQIDLSNNINLKVLNIRNNQLKNLDLENNTELSELKADYNKLSDIDFDKNLKLLNIELNNNQIISLNLRNQKELKKLTAFSNPLQSLSLFNEKNIRLLSVEDTPYSHSKLKVSNKNSISNLLAPRVSIIEAGLIKKNGNQYNFFSTKLINPKLGQYIGFRYLVTLPKDKRGQIDAELRTQYQFPIRVRMKHPKIIDPKTGKGFTVSNWSDTMFKNQKNLAMWYFGEKNELVEGLWTLEIIYRNLVIAKKSFLLINSDKKSNQSLLRLSTLLLQGEKIICPKDKFRRCLNFNTIDSCENNIKPFNKLCQKAVLSLMKTKNTNPNTQLKKYITYYMTCMSIQYIKKTDLSFKEVGMCFTKID